MSAPLRAVDVAVIGGGLVGCSAALHLALAGTSVILLERDATGAKASGVNFGGVRQHGRHLGELPLSTRSRAIWGRLRELVGHDCEFTASGHLKIARTEAEMAELQAWAPVGQAHELAVELLGRDTLRRRFPWLSGDVVGASFCARDGQANPRLAGPAFARAAAQAGVEICEFDGVGDVEPRNDGFYLTTQSGRLIRAESVVNAAGAWGGALAARFCEEVPVKKVAPQMFVTEPTPYVIEPSFGMVGGAVYLRQIPRGNVIFGGGRGEVLPDGDTSRPSMDVFNKTVSLAHRLIPHLAKLPIIRSWTGIEGDMPDSLPVIGPSATQPGLFHAFGFSGHGFQMAPAVGAVLAELICKGRTDTDISAFDIRRFAPVEQEETRQGIRP